MYKIWGSCDAQVRPEPTGGQLGWCFHINSVTIFCKGWFFPSFVLCWVPSKAPQWLMRNVRCTYSKMFSPRLVPAWLTGLHAVTHNTANSVSCLQEESVHEAMQYMREVWMLWVTGKVCTYHKLNLTTQHHCSLNYVLSQTKFNNSAPLFLKLCHRYYLFLRTKFGALSTPITASQESSLVHLPCRVNWCVNSASTFILP